MNLKAFIFDLFGVIISFDETIVYQRIAKYCNDSEQAAVALKGLVSCPKLITSQITLQDVYHDISEKHGLSLTYDEFEILWLEPYTESMLGMSKILETLQSKYQLLLLSNVDPYYWLTVRARHPEVNYFDSILLSCGLGIAKPDHRVFSYAATVAELSPSECFFVDDKAENIKAAQSCGFNAYLFDGISGLQKTLKCVGAK